MIETLEGIHKLSKDLQLKFRLVPRGDRHVSLVFHIIAVFLQECRNANRDPDKEVPILSLDDIINHLLSFKVFPPNDYNYLRRFLRGELAKLVNNRVIIRISKEEAKKNGIKMDVPGKAKFGYTIAPGAVDILRYIRGWRDFFFREDILLPVSLINASEHIRFLLDRKTRPGPKTLMKNCDVRKAGKAIMVLKRVSEKEAAKYFDNPCRIRYDELERYIEEDQKIPLTPELEEIIEKAFRGGEEADSERISLAFLAGGQDARFV